MSNHPICPCLHFNATWIHDLKIIQSFTSLRVITACPVQLISNRCLENSCLWVTIRKNCWRLAPVIISGHVRPSAFYIEGVDLAYTGNKTCNGQIGAKGGVGSCRIIVKNFLEINWSAPILFEFAQVYVNEGSKYSFVEHPSRYRDSMLCLFDWIFVFSDN